MIIGKQIDQIHLYNQNRNLTPVIDPDFQVNILCFFPGAFTDLCNIGLTEFNLYLNELDCEISKVTGITVDSTFVLEKWKTDHEIDFDLLSDHELRLIEEFEVEFLGLGGVENYRSANRAVFFTDAQGCVIFEWIGNHPGDAPDYKFILSKAKSFESEYKPKNNQE